MTQEDERFIRICPEHQKELVPMEDRTSGGHNEHLWCSEEHCTSIWIVWDRVFKKKVFLATIASGAIRDYRLSQGV
jgi:hypothetical protein